MNVVQRKKGKMTGNRYSLYFGRHVECETKVKTGTSVTGLVIMRLGKSPGKGKAAATWRIVQGILQKPKQSYYIINSRSVFSNT